MRPENQKMSDFLAPHFPGIRVKYIATGSLKRTWRLHLPDTKWTEEAAVKLNELGFTSFDRMPLGKFSGNGGTFQVFVRGHDEMLS